MIANRFRKRPSLFVDTERLLTGEFGSFLTPLAVGSVPIGGGPTAPGCFAPLTAISPKYESNFCVSSTLEIISNNSGVSSIKFVVTFPLKNAFDWNTFCKKGTFVFTPRMRNSAKDLYIFCTAPSKDCDVHVNFTSNES